MYYRIADVIIESEVVLPSFDSFQCEAGDPDVKIILTDERPEDGEEVNSGFIQQRKTPDGWFFHYVRDEVTGLIINDDYTRLQLTGHYEKEAGASILTANNMEESMVRMAIECRLALRGYVSLHAACIELDGEAYTFSGPSGTGKSTRANAWMGAFEEAELVSGDRPLIGVKDLEVYGVPWDGKEQCYRNVRYPLKAIFEVRRKETGAQTTGTQGTGAQQTATLRTEAPGNGHETTASGTGAASQSPGTDSQGTGTASRAYIRRMTYEQKRKLLMRQCFIPMWDTETAVIQMMNIAKLASTAPILRAFCGRYEADAVALKAAFESAQYEKEGTDLKAKEGFVLRDIVGEKILMPTGGNIGKFKGTVLLNDVSAFVWNKLQTPMSRDDLLAAILDEFEVEESVAAADLDALLATFDEYGVIEKD